MMVPLQRSRPARPIGFFRSLAGRMTLAWMLLVVAVMLLLYAITRTALLRHEQAALQASIDTDLAGLADIYISGGERELVQRLNERIEFQSGTPGSHYLLLGRGEQRLAGNLHAWPRLEASASQAGLVRLADGKQALARGTLLAPHLRLLVARDLRALDGVMASLRNAFAVASLLALALALLAGLRFSRRLQRRIDAINRLYAGMEPAGAPESQSAPFAGDEIDQLHGSTEQSLLRIRGLLEAYRDISDHTAHEIRTPLMHLDHGLVKMLENTVDPRMIDGLSAARENVRSTIRMLESLLDISAVRARTGDAGGLEEIDLSALVSEIVDIYRDSAEDMGYRLDGEIEPGVSMRADAMQLRRLISNLLDNALKYCPPGTRVKVVLEAGPRLRVEDDGPGIPPAEQARIFDKFRRGSQNRQVGHGLGLALARAIAERHGMNLRLDADYAQGARFILEFPESGLPHPSKQPLR